MHLQVETLFMKGILSQQCAKPYCKSVEEEQYVTVGMIRITYHGWVVEASV